MPVSQPHSPSARILFKPADAPPLMDLPNANSRKEGDSQHPDTTQEWTSILDAMTKHDEQMLLHWKDDLSNLLVFAGLFSGVVTGFAVASYPWLQPAGSDPFLQVQLLVQISEQLASLSVVPGFINSTAQPSPSLTVPPSSGPTDVQIRINILWFLSLGIGLITSLLAIVVQQWLREYGVPEYLTVRDRVQLRQLRYQGLITWGVPQIVSILPVLLQVALILFLTGLYNLLDSLNGPVAKAFIAFVGSALALYAALTVLPIAFRQCPYRSPLADLMIRAYSLMGITLSLVAAVVVVLSLILVNFYFIFADWIRSKGPVGSRAKLMKRRMVTVIVRFASKVVTNLSNILLSFGRNQRWLARDIRLLIHRQPASLDADALIWSPRVVKRDDRPMLDICLQDLPQEQRSRCIVSWAALALDTRASTLAESITTEAHPLNHAVIKRINLDFARRFQAHLQDAFLLPSQYTKGLTSGSTGLVVLAMLRQTLALKGVSVQNDFVKHYAQGIMSIRGRQTPRQIKTAQGWVRLPTQCLFECSMQFLYTFSHNDISQLFGFALQMQDLLHPFHLFNYEFRFDCLELILLSAATALHAVCRVDSLLQGSLLWPDLCRKMLLGLSDVLKYNRHYTSRRMVQPTSWIRYFSQRRFNMDKTHCQISLRSISPAVNKLNHCLAYLRQTDSLPEVLSHDHTYGYDVPVQSLQDAILEAFPKLTSKIPSDALGNMLNPGNSGFPESDVKEVGTENNVASPIDRTSQDNVAVSSTPASETGLIMAPPPDTQSVIPASSFAQGHSEPSRGNAVLDPGEPSGISVSGGVV